jgi:large subunit ribosomal protein L24
MAETAKKIKLHVKRGDKVVIIAGKDKDRQGKIIRAIPKKGKVVVEGINTVKRHAKPSQKLPQGGIITKEAPLASSNVMLICPSCNKATRIVKKQVKDNYARACKKCGNIVDSDK